MRTWLRYFLIAVLAWVVVDFTTTPAVGNPRAYYSKYMPALLLFYIGYPLIFSALIYRLKLRVRGLFLAMLVGIVLVEIVFTRNMLLLTLPICLLAIPLALAHYSMVTFMPWWIAERNLRKNRWPASTTLAGWSFGVLLNILSQFGHH